MTGPEFFRTAMGRQYYERTLPEMARQMERVADALERIAPAQSAPVRSEPGPFKPGDKVVIDFNPHHPAASDIVGRSMCQKILISIQQ